MTRPIVARIDPLVALPFITAYCRTWNVPMDNLEAANDIWWWGAFLGGRIRGVMGFQLITPTTMFVWGFYGDGSGTLAERQALARLNRVADDLGDKLGYDLIGVLLLENSRMRRVIARHRWKFEEFESAAAGRARWRWKRPALREIREAVTA